MSNEKLTGRAYVHIEKFGERKAAYAESHMPNMTARLAMSMIEKWGVVSAVEDGCDEAGRHKLKPMDVPDVVARAFDMAELAISTATARGLMIDMEGVNSELIDSLELRDK